MGRWAWWYRTTAAAATAAVLGVSGLALAPAASAAARVCTSAADPALAGTMSRDILASLRGRKSAVGLAVDDPAAGITCALNSTRHFYSASVVKVTILAALLRKAGQQHRGLSSREQAYAWKMITESDNAAATALWNDTGMYWLQHFLGLAKMRQTVLGKGGYWGLTQITAHDESLLLRLLVTSNQVLTTGDRDYELSLMARVIPAQRWGTPVGVPATYQVHVKNGWLPVPGYGWFINSLGAFTRPGGGSYTMDVLTDHNPSMSYGVTTVEDVAHAANRALAARAGAAAVPAVPRSTPAPGWGRPDERIPARLIPGH